VNPFLAVHPTHILVHRAHRLKSAAVGDMKVTERLIAGHALTNTDCSMRKLPGERRHKQSLPPFVTFA